MLSSPNDESPANIEAAVSSLQQFPHNFYFADVLFVYMENQLCFHEFNYFG
jgi:hypothetical protein